MALARHELSQRSWPENGRSLETCDTTAGLPRLLVEHPNPHRTVASLRDILASEGSLFDRGVPVRLAYNQIERGHVAQELSPDNLVMIAHSVCRPIKRLENKDDKVVERVTRLPISIARMYLDWLGEWRLPPFNGIASAPLLQDDGSIRSTVGYDTASGLWCENVPDVASLVPTEPSRDCAAAALNRVRSVFRTFCFEDSEMILDPESGCEVVDVGALPGQDESGFLVALLTAVCRPSLYLSPGILLRAAPMSGAGAGKGLLARCISQIAFGREPHAVTGGANSEELEKRISAELMQGGPILFLDNLNNKAFRSNLLASAITERPARVRVLGKSRMVPINATAFIVLTGNGLSISEDLARRFIEVNLDPGMEDPESRTFKTDIRAYVKSRRVNLLADALTIWRWGRQAGDIKPGRTLGSFEQWSLWVRDPLLALGCSDPVERISEAKERDSQRQLIVEIFAAWSAQHGEEPVTASQLSDEVKAAIDPHNRGRQFISAQLQKLSGTRISGYVLDRQSAPGKWGRATYALVKAADPDGHRDHRVHKPPETPSGPTPPPHDPYAPYADSGSSEKVFGHQELAQQASAAPQHRPLEENEPRDLADDQSRFWGRI